MAKEKNQKLVAMGHTIRSLREGRGLTQEEFAFKAGLDRSYYGGVERGERNISALNIMGIAEALEVEVGCLFPPIKVLAELPSK